MPAASLIRIIVSSSQSSSSKDNTYSVALNYAMLIIHSFFNIKTFIISSVLDTAGKCIKITCVSVFSSRPQILLKRELIILIALYQI